MRDDFWREWGCAAPPHGGVEWGKGDHNHPLPFPRECHESNGRVQHPHGSVKQGDGDHNHPLPTPQRHASESGGRVQPPQWSVGWVEGGHNHPLPAPQRHVSVPAGGRLRPKINFFSAGALRAEAYGPLKSAARDTPRPARGWHRQPRGQPSRLALGWPRPRPHTSRGRPTSPKERKTTRGSTPAPTKPGRGTAGRRGKPNPGVRVLLSRRTCSGG